MDFFRDLLGGESKTGMNASIEQNDRVRGQMHDIARASQDAIYQFLPRGMEAQRQAGTKMFQMMKQVPQRQMNAYRQNNTNAQRALLGGLKGYEAGILGNQAADPRINPLAGVEGMSQMFANVDMPHFMKQGVRNPRREGK